MIPYLSEWKHSAGSSTFPESGWLLDVIGPDPSVSLDKMGLLSFFTIESNHKTTILRCQ